ncbi:MAG: hypothetical protein KKD39_01325 [Candidatus Altiarchaeota archaeon]|nr:hypothetical protein [Candidatus Altiarchaeota archaeon]
MATTAKPVSSGQALTPEQQRQQELAEISKLLRDKKNADALNRVSLLLDNAYGPSGSDGKRAIKEGVPERQVHDAWRMAGEAYVGLGGKANLMNAWRCHKAAGDNTSADKLMGALSLNPETVPYADMLDVLPVISGRPLVSDTSEAAAIDLKEYSTAVREDVRQERMREKGITPEKVAGVAAKRADVARTRVDSSILGARETLTRSVEGETPEQYHTRMMDAVRQYSELVDGVESMDAGQRHTLANGLSTAVTEAMPGASDQEKRELVINFSLLGENTLLHLEVD